MTYLAVLVYIGAALAANLIVAALGPWISPVLAFVFIGLDLALRDWLHVRLSLNGMLCVIFAASTATYILNPAAANIAGASAIAFTAAALADWAVFSALRRSEWLKRSVWSNVAGAAVDSVLFPALAWGAFLPGVVVAQFAAKAIGGGFWAWVMSRFFRA